MKKKPKKFFFSCVGQALLNERFNKKYPDYDSFRIEIFHKDYQYDIEEVHFILPRKICQKIRDAFEFEEVDFFHIGKIYSEDLEKIVKKILKDEKEKTYRRIK